MDSSPGRSPTIESTGTANHALASADVPHFSLEQLFAAVAQIMVTVDAIHRLIAGAVKPLYTIAEVAKLTGRSDYTVRRWVSEGKISAIRVGDSGPRGKLLIAREELDKLIAEGRGSKITATVCGAPSSTELT